MAKEKKIRIQFLLDKEIDVLLEQLAEKERRTKSAIVELAILLYAKQDATRQSDSGPAAQSGPTPELPHD
jgi:predicted transcriptional regulator